MEKHAVEHLVSKALARERRIWMSLVACMIFFQVVAILSPSEGHGSINTSLEPTHVARRRLMNVGATPMPEEVGPAPAPEADNRDTVLKEAQCNCPAGPRGPPGEPAPEFLSQVFEWDEQRNALIIKASTMDLGGHLIVNGFTGIRQSLFIGGDPSNGESATEISPGSLLLYSKGSNAPTIAGFTTDENGYTPASVEVQGGVTSVDPDTAEATPLTG